MELDLDDRNALVPIDDDSGSAYEESSRGEESEDHSPDEKPWLLSISGTPKSRKENSENGSKERDSNEVDNGAISGPDEDDLENLKTDHDSDERIQEDAKKWAATFEAPQSPAQIRSPLRQEAGSRKRRQREEPPQGPSKARAKRFKSFYSNEYRELLNSEIHDASTFGSIEDETALGDSQIGSSLWTAKEKDVLFSALERLGRDNVAAIALHIGTKSEVEVQDYIHLLHKALEQRLAEDDRKQVLHIVDYPAALEISEECCGVLERAADSLSTRQDCYEIAKEEAKWYGDSWLLTQKLSKTIHIQRRDPDEEAELEATLPAANLFNLKNWLELSREIFMNQGVSNASDSWQNLAEPGESPAIRTTAFEDFYSLAVSVTKRLISTTLFCTMSRQRARDSKLFKHADVTEDDVEAAIKMLGLQANSREFWTKCARRCQLEVIDDENSATGDNVPLTYEEVELAMAGDSTFPAQPQLLSEIEQRQKPTIASTERVDVEDLTDSSELEHSHSDDSWHSEDFYESDEEDGFSSSFARQKLRNQKIEEKKKMLRAQDEFTEAIDTRESQLEEARLWSMLHQTAPFDLQPDILPDRPRFTKHDTDGVSSWRANTEYWSTWEMMITPVPNQSFVDNREVKSNRAKRKERAIRDRESDEKLSSSGDSEASEHATIITDVMDRERGDGGEEVQNGDDTGDTERLENERQSDKGDESSQEEQINAEDRSPSPEPPRSESP